MRHRILGAFAKATKTITFCCIFQMSKPGWVRKTGRVVVEAQKFSRRQRSLLGPSPTEWGRARGEVAARWRWKPSPKFDEDFEKTSRRKILTILNFKAYDAPCMPLLSSQGRTDPPISMNGATFKGIGITSHRLLNSVWDLRRIILGTRGKCISTRKIIARSAIDWRRQIHLPSETPSWKTWFCKHSARRQIYPSGAA